MTAADMVARLAQQGIDPLLLSQVAEALFTGEIESRKLSERRESDRSRKAKSRDVTGQHVTSGTERDRVSLDKERSPRPPKEINPIPCVQGTRARLGYHRLPEGWRPSAPLPPQLKAKCDQWPPGTFADEVAAFKRWAANAEDKNGKGRKLDWDKALWNWLGRRHDERHARSNAVGRHQSNDGLSATTRAAIAVFGDPRAGHQ